MSAQPDARKTCRSPAESYFRAGQVLGTQKVPTFEEALDQAGRRGESRAGRRLCSLGDCVRAGWDPEDVDRLVLGAAPLALLRFRLVRDNHDLVGRDP